MSGYVDPLTAWARALRASGATKKQQAGERAREKRRTGGDPARRARLFGFMCGGFDSHYPMSSLRRPLSTEFAQG
jgi:hypothetical protein